MKVIDLLNKIANGEEVPKRIAIQNKVLIYNEDEILNLQDCYYMNDDEDATWKIWAYKLTDEVEIIEEPQEHKIPEKLISTSLRGIDNLDEKIEVSHIDTINVIDKINEILDYLEEIE